MQERALTGASWHQEDFDVDAYLALTGVDRSRPGIALLEELHRAHVWSIPFANVDVLLGEHPGVAPATVQRQLVERGRGGYCFEHAQLFAAVLEALGFDVRRHLGRVHSPYNSRTHMTVAVSVEGDWHLTDPGFGFSIRGPLAMHDGARRLEGGRSFVLEHQVLDGADRWTLRRDGELQHITDALTVQPIDVYTGHIVTSSSAGPGRFTRSLVVSRLTEEGHVTVTQDSRTVRADGQPTVHEAISTREALEAIRDLGIRLVDDQPGRLRGMLDGMRRTVD